MELESIQEQIVMNFRPAGKVREETLNGRKYLVCPGNILGEDVIVGSRGPIFYSHDENSKWATTWNHKPIILYHPPGDQSGCDPDILESSQLGMLLNTHPHDPSKKIKTELWVDDELLTKHDTPKLKMRETINNGEAIEISTGLGMDLLKTPGEFSKKKYFGSAKNHRPDHLALLPGRVGAYSIAAGGGMNVYNEVKKRLVELAQRDGIELPKGWVENTLEPSMAEHHGMVSRALQGHKESNGSRWNGYVESVHPSHVIYSEGGQMYAHQYEKKDDGSIKMKGKPIPVTRISEYRTADGTPLATNQLQETPMAFDKTKFVDELVANHGWEAHDKDWLLGLDQPRLEKLKKPAPVPTPAPTVVPPPVVNQQPLVVTPVVVKPMTAEEYIQNAPPVVREMLQEGLDQRDARKNTLIEAIIANERNVFTKENLAGRPIHELEAMAALAGVNQPQQVTQGLYIGAGAGMSPVQQKVNNQRPLTTPDLWSDRLKKTTPAAAAK